MSLEKEVANELLNEIARQRERIEKLEAAIRWMYGYDEPGTPPFPVELNSRYGWRKVGRELPGVRAALGEVEREG